MAKQVRIDTATGEVTDTREHPTPVHKPATWYDEQRDAEPAFDHDTQIVEQDNKVVDGKYVFGFTVRNLNTQELDDVLAAKWVSVRAKRENLLRNSDFTQLDDSPKDKQAWKTYRVALRDITEQVDPDNITWPVAPND